MKKSCFVCMPMIGELDEIYQAIEREIKDTLGGQWMCERAEDRTGPGMAMETVISALLNSSLVIAVVADPRESNTINPNVMYELAIAHSFRKPTIVIADKKNELPFDIRQVETILLHFSNPTLPAELRRLLQKSLRSPEVLNDLGRQRIPRNPITTQLKDAHVFIEDLPWVWGYCDVLKRERSATTVWEITRDLYWPSEPLFFESIKEAIRKRKKHYFMVENDEGVLRRVENIKNSLHRDFAKTEVSELLHFVAIDSSYFVLWPIAIVLYDADLATHESGIICEPMESQVGDDWYDEKIQAMFAQHSRSGDLEAFQKDIDQMDWIERRKESTFDISLDKRVVGKLATSFAKIWNAGILEEAQKKSGDDKSALLTTWLIGG